ncbi:D-alanine--D-alanine ligase family protein [Yimella sp. cx-51]|uniref:D-alanine--D-alanine ligase family protein n=1 Tax=Yimella sp. cx-51 TaxID=2770551 RepID=UPI00165E3329|nr:D-alanine--D-alanine ligase family protein [Yimella sp. cx-51]MBC9956723.1 D-alanine--D-alanine ligase [Yimella sp. cx-51]QTH38961.1 D-alanine--D-alanine ligase [Yimella sp. cx-51]
MTTQPPSPDTSTVDLGASRDRKPVVALVFGGRSAEHVVSCATAASVLRSIDRERYDVLPIGITETGRWVLMADDPEPLQLTATHKPAVSGDNEVLVSPDPAGHSLSLREPGQVPRELGEVDVVFPLLHGPFGEDGTIQGLLELSDMRYVGSGVSASAVMMDKHLMKVVFRSAGLPVGPYVLITDKEWQRDPAASMDPVAALGWPVFVKPARAGSSVGVTRVESADQLKDAIEHARQFDPKVLVEAAIVGREVECGILEGRGSDPARASQVGEIAVTEGTHAFYDFESKYLDDSARLICPADLPEDIAETIREQSIKAFDAAGCEGLARVDWFYSPDGTLTLNEINTMPGFTPTSMYPRVWDAQGVSYRELITELIELALQRRLGLR